ncbi:MAG: sialate O-acetylesterase [Tannerella sp.]|jgi:sialate O-acetylesterase|nr:sialate O-acetylesterase [Tannerella sp.]
MLLKTGKWMSVMLLFFTVGMAIFAQGQLALPSVFGDGMVMQRQTDAPVWGWAASDTEVRITGSWLPNDTVVVRTGGEGVWETTIRTAEAGGPYTLTVINKTDVKEFHGVMLGEVWLCSGQSNMQWSALRGIVNQEAEIAAANYPDIRIFHTPRRIARTPQNDCDASWTPCTPQTMSQTSAVSYFFARRLHTALRIPVGLIVSAWGGTGYEVWTKRELIENNPMLQADVPKIQSPWVPVKPGLTYNQMIHPVIPFAIAGVIWYQGSNNVDHYATYGLGLQTMINGWRSEFRKEFPFYLVQIAPCRDEADTTGNMSACLREQQEFVSRLVPKTAMVVISDLVDDITDVHPRDKQNVGLRLANLALAETYGQPLKNYRSPLFREMRVENGKAIISFDYAEAGLMCTGTHIEGLKIAGADRQYVDAEGIIEGDKLIVFSPKIKTPAAVMFCFDNDTMGNLFSGGGLPVAPFRTDRIISFFNQINTNRHE